MLTMGPLIEIIENQLILILAIVTRSIKVQIMNYLIKLQMIVTKTIAEFIRNTRKTIIALITQDQSNMMLVQMIKIMKM